MQMFSLWAFLHLRVFGEEEEEEEGLERIRAVRTIDARQATGRP